MTEIGFSSELPVKRDYFFPLPAQDADGVLGVSFNILFHDFRTKCSSVLMMFNRTSDLED